MSTYPYIPPILAEIQKHLVQHPCRISSAMDDGRINSAINEDEVLNFLEKPVGGIKLVEKNDEKVAHIVDF